MLIKADGGNHRGYLGGNPGVENLLASHGVQAVVCYRSAHNGELRRCYAERTLPRIEVEAHVYIVVDTVIVFQEPRNSTIIKICGGLAFVEFVD